MSNLICAIKGHMWVNGKCHRCGLVCSHETIEKYDDCTDCCTTCRMGFPHHNWQDTDMAWKKVCSVCGKEDIDVQARILWERAEKAKKAETEKQVKEAALKKLLDSHYIKNSNTDDSIGNSAINDQFRCIGCGNVFPLSEKSSTYNRPICKECAKQVKSYYGHTVIDKIDGYSRTVTCINCLQSEDWQDAKHQGSLLKDLPCSE